jgi:hypothetical protein
VQNTDELLPPIDYSVVWLILGIALILVLALYFAAILFFTRHKDIKTIGSLPILPAQPVDLTELKAKYLNLIADVEQSFNSRKVLSRDAHQRLSMIVRYFAFEASGFRAHIMTLSDIEKADRHNLAETIKQYYPPEFNGLNDGSVAEAAVAARGVVQSW